LNASPIATHSDDKPNPQKADKPQSKINDENVKKIKQGIGKLTEADVVALLGPSTGKGRPFDGFTSRIWEEKTHITATLKDGKAIDVKSEFLPHLKSKTITEDNFKKLKKGMDEAELKRILGPPNRARTDREGSSTLSWEKINALLVQFKEGKVTGYEWEKTTEEKKPPEKQPPPSEKKRERPNQPLKLTGPASRLFET